ncbi:sensor domain-containing diguanylate cyclase [Frigidibacter sp.]|uniref:sensor domain-containing diguanylate cyclase n=1 Tax=Frigidibacter sp. TaxID=2586418 RepID=UPI0027324C8A|nr:sensor domain-containing diguanylate cyclase [Frigidibacter sp.]MDP3340390.1 sensor domain-containing diguanylate cyclase [Frigidibacter sp.]
MKHNQRVQDEMGRLAALRRYAILDTPAAEPFDKLTQLVRDVLGVPIAAVSLVDAERQWFKSIVGLPVCETSREVSFCSHAIRRNEPMLVPDATEDPRFAMNPLVTGDPGIRSYLGIPLTTPDGYNLGALCAIDTQPRRFDATQIAVMQSFANLVLNELELRQIAMSDGLTGAMTRRGLVEAAEREIARSRRYGSAASVIVLDVDHFKLVNDVYGHPTGDAVLRMIAQRCMGALREGDLFGRLGGEEFAVLLPQTDAKGALDLAERLREVVAAAPVDANGVSLRVTASFGVCSLTGDIETADVWLAVADALLYEAKAGGRNCCRSSVPSQ